MCNSCGAKSNHRLKRTKIAIKKRDKCRENKDKNEESPKCPDKKRLPTKPKKSLTKVEKIMMRIQPSIADRERYLHPEHVNCFLEESERVYIKKPAYGSHPFQRPKVCAEDNKNKTKKKSNHDIEDGENKNGEMKRGKKEKEAGNEKDIGSDAVEKKPENDIKTEGSEEKVDRKKTKRQVKMNQKKKKQKKRRGANFEDESDSEISICSIDSEVCLVGSRLTKEDMKLIEENRQKVHPPPDNEDKTVEGDDNVPDATQQGNNEA